jgi:hypothetical protein
MCYEQRREVEQELYCAWLYFNSSLKLSLSPILRPTASRASLSWNKAPVWVSRPDFYYCQTVAGLLMWDAVYDEMTGLSFRIAPGPRQRCHFQARVLWDSWPYLTASDSRLPFSSPPTTRKAKVEVFDPASTRDSYCWIKAWSPCNKDSVHTSQETHYVSATQPNRVMLFREIIAVNFENHTEHLNKLCEKSAFFYVLKQMAHIITLGLTVSCFCC